MQRAEAAAATPEKKLAAHLDPYLKQLANDVTTLAASINAATCEWLMLIAEFDEMKAWRQDTDIESTAAWLAWKCRLGKGTAREKVRVARALQELPKIREAFSSGELSYSVVRELTRIANPARESALVEMTRYCTAAHVERLCQQMQQVDNQIDAAQSARNMDQRYARWFQRSDGCVELRAVLMPDQGQTVVAVLDKLCSELVQESSAESEVRGYQNPKAQQRADAVERLAELAMRIDAESEMKAANDDALDNAINDATNDATGHRARLTGGDITTLMVHVDADQLRDVPHGTLGRMSCDCAVITSLKDATGNPMSVGRKTRSIPPAIRRALQRRDIGCTFPGCGHHRYVDAHHVQHWSQGGETSLQNLTLLCRRHHRLIHEGGYHLTMSPAGRLTYFTSGGDIVSAAPRMSAPAETICERNLRNGVQVNERTVQTKWDGTAPDYSLMVDVLIRRDNRAVRHPEGDGASLDEAPRGTEIYQH